MKKSEHRHRDRRRRHKASLHFFSKWLEEQCTNSLNQFVGLTVDAQVEISRLQIWSVTI